MIERNGLISESALPDELCRDVENAFKRRYLLAKRSLRKVLLSRYNGAHNIEDDRRIAREKFILAKRQYDSAHRLMSKPTDPASTIEIPEVIGYEVSQHVSQHIVMRTTDLFDTSGRIIDGNGNGQQKTGNLVEVLSGGQIAFVRSYESSINPVSYKLIPTTQIADL